MMYSVEFSKESIVKAMSYVRLIKLPNATFLGKLLELLEQCVKDDAPYFRFTVESSKGEKKS